MKHTQALPLLSYTIVIPTRRTFRDIEPLVQCIRQQTVHPQEVIIVYDVAPSKEQYMQYEQDIQHIRNDTPIHCTIISTHTDKGFIPKKGASYVRNYGIRKVQTPLLCSVDDDNVFSATFFEEFLHTYNVFLFHSVVDTEGIFIPTELYRDTNTVRSQGYCGFNYLLTRPKKFFIQKKTIADYIPIQLASSNCLFGSTSLFQKVPFDERFLFVYEDMMMTADIARRYRSLYLAPKITTHHMMRHKTKVEDLYIGTPFDAYQKARNRIFFAKHHATFRQKVQFFGFGLWGHTCYLLLQTLRYRPQNIFAIRKEIFRGTYDGLKT